MTVTFTGLDIVLRDMVTYENIILLSWAAFLLVWGVLAFNVKRDVRGGGFASWLRQWLLLRFAVAAAIAIISLRLVTGTARRSGQTLFSQGSMFSPPLVVGWIAAALAVVGVGFAIWARVYLGRNWSSQPAVKENHELVTAGPYAYVRHPIYTGMALATFGAALTGNIVGIGMLFFACVLFAQRIRQEEAIMLELFPNEYPTYRARTKRLVPFLW